MRSKILEDSIAIIRIVVTNIIKDISLIISEEEVVIDHTEVEGTKIKGIERGLNVESVVVQITTQKSAFIGNIAKNLDMKLYDVLQRKNMSTSKRE